MILSALLLTTMLIYEADTVRGYMDVDRHAPDCDCEGRRVRHLIWRHPDCALSKKRPSRDAIARDAAHIGKVTFLKKEARGLQKGHAGVTAAANRILFQK